MAYRSTLDASKRSGGLGLGDFVSTLLARPPCIVLPKVEHCLAEMLDDIATIEINILYEGAALLTIEDDVLMFAGGGAVARPQRRGYWEVERAHVARWQE